LAIDRERAGVAAPTTPSRSIRRDSGEAAATSRT
jgi:hypothetical protein